MTEALIRNRYAAIVAGLSSADVGRLWMRVLAGHRTDDAQIEARAEPLDRLRDDVGRASAMRRNEKATAQ